MKNGKRILSVKIIRQIDESPDTNYLGEYSNRATSEYSIDRAHSEDCANLRINHATAVETLERIIHAEARYGNRIRLRPRITSKQQWSKKNCPHYGRN